MSRMIRTLILLLAVGLSGTGYAAAPLKPQTSNQSAVTVKAVPRNVQDGAWEFEVVFDTHAQELRDDLLQKAVLVAADGRLVKPAAWQADAPGGHHRKGVLRFDGIGPQPEMLELRITRTGEAAPRVFKWNLKQR